MTLKPSWSRRKSAQNASTADVYQYISISQKLKRQFLYMIEDCGKQLRLEDDKILNIYKIAVDTLRRELGLRALADGGDYQHSFRLEFTNWLLAAGNVDNILDSIEFIVEALRYCGEKRYFEDGNEKVQRQIEIFNARLLEDGTGYQIRECQIIQISNEFLHSEVVLSALELLREKAFANANSEFLKAHSEFRDGSYEDCLIDCCKALESVLKVIASKRNWGLPDTATAKTLLDAAFTNSLVPAMLQSSFQSLRSMLESGVPTLRNKQAGHGQGTATREIPAHLAAFQIHQTAAVLVFLAECDRVAT